MLGIYTSMLQGGTQAPIVGGQTGCPYLGTNRQPSVFGGQAGSPYWGTNRLPLLVDKEVALIGDKHVALIDYPMSRLGTRVICSHRILYDRLG